MPCRGTGMCVSQQTAGTSPFSHLREEKTLCARQVVGKWSANGRQMGGIIGKSPKHSRSPFISLTAAAPLMAKKKKLTKKKTKALRVPSPHPIDVGRIAAQLRRHHPDNRFRRRYQPIRPSPPLDVRGCQREAPSGKMRSDLELVVCPANEGRA